jgi:hypothetical protein
MYRRPSSLLFSTAASIATLVGLGLGVQASLAANPFAITGSGLIQVVEHPRLLAIPATIAGNGGVAHLLNGARLLTDTMLIVDKGALARIGCPSSC